jgi:hypothetical protein
MVAYCNEQDPQTQLLDKTVAMGRLLLTWWAAAQQPPTPPPPGCTGLLTGPPEHDWGSITNLHFYNNNAWTLRGMERLAGFLLSSGYPNATFVQQLQAAAVTLRADLMASVAACTVYNGSVPVFLPPYALVNATPYKSMTESSESSCTFRQLL